MPEATAAPGEMSRMLATLNQDERQQGVARGPLQRASAAIKWMVDFVGTPSGDSAWKGGLSAAIETGIEEVTRLGDT